MKKLFSSLIAALLIILPSCSWWCCQDRCQRCTECGEAKPVRHKSLAGVKGKEVTRKVVPPSNEPPASQRMM
ncbi:hypothetical protein M1446_01790 [Candidatus Dependentiae bacterium]|nr:hypothetical protein [Candidatus Dependentiae bacterium]